ncbi:MAG: DUF1793 domain-containing protein [Candidatus Sulfotelmatobacter sp.]
MEDCFVLIEDGLLRKEQPRNSHVLKGHRYDTIGKQSKAIEKHSIVRWRTWSQKYNLVWDQVLGYNLFPKTVRETEVAFYVGKINRYGLPLDIRVDYTKLDWSVWTATLASNPEQFNALIDPIYRWINETPNRVPLTDWYDTKTGKQTGFQARSVVGGVYMKALSDNELTAKWRAVGSHP